MPMPHYFNLFFITSITSSSTFPLLITAPFISVSYLCSSPNKLVTLPPAYSTISLAAAISQFLCSLPGNIAKLNSPDITTRKF